MIITHNPDDSYTVSLNDVSFQNPQALQPDGPAVWPEITIAAGTTPHQAWVQILALAAANGIRVLPQMVLVNASGTTGTVIQ